MYFANNRWLENSPLSSKSRAPGLTLQQVFPLDELDRIPTMFFGYPYAGIVEQWYFHNDAFSIPFQSDTTWIHCRHTIRFGAVFTPEGESELANPSNNNTNGSYTFLGELTGNPLADFMLNYASNYTETALDPFGKYRWYNLEPYIEDQVKLRKNLTLTAALRYEFYRPEHELHNMLGGFDPALYNPAEAPTVNQDGEITNNGNPLDGIIVAGNNSYAGANSSPYGQALFPSHKLAFAPRLGSLGIPSRMARRRFVPGTAFSTTDGAHTANLERTTLLSTAPSIFSALRLIIPAEHQVRFFRRV